MATKKLTNKDDEYTLDNKTYTQIEALAGNDTITIAAGSPNGVIVNAGAGNDTITLASGSRHQVNLTSGANRVNINAGIEHVIKGGTENDIVIIKNDAAVRGCNEVGAPDANGLTSLTPVAPTVSLGKGNDTVTLNGGRRHLIYTDDGMNTTAAKGAGNDLVYVFGGQYNIVQMAGGKDTLKIYSKNNAKQDIKGNTFATGADEDTIVVGSETATVNGVFANRIQAGAGRDKLTLTKGAMSNFIWGDAGDDVIVINGGYANKIYGDSKPTSTLADGAGKDTVTITGGESNYVHTADGADYITLSGTNEVTKNRIHAGMGNDTITVEGGKGNALYGDEDDDSIFVEGGTGNYIYGGTGADYISLTGASGSVIFGDKGYTDSEEDGDDAISVHGGSNSRLYGNGGNDLLSYDTEASSVGIKMFGGAGNDTISLYGSTGANIQGGTGNDYITITETENTTVLGQKGNDMITVDSAHNKIYGDYDSWWDYELDGSLPYTFYSDTISLTENANNCTVDAGKGKNVIECYGANCKITAEEGSDTITVEDRIGTKVWNLRDGGFNTEVHAGGGNDTITVKTGTKFTASDNLEYGSYVKVSGGAGDDLIKYEKGCGKSYAMSFSYAFGGSGNDTFIIDGGDVVAVGGKGNDTFVNYTHIQKGGSYDIGGAGNDTYCFDFSQGLNYENCHYLNNALNHGSGDKDVIKLIGYTGSLDDIILSYFKEGPALIEIEDPTNRLKEINFWIEGYQTISEIMICDAAGNKTKSLGNWEQFDSTWRAAGRYEELKHLESTAEKWMSSSDYYSSKDYEAVKAFIASDSDIKLAGNGL